MSATIVSLFPQRRPPEHVAREKILAEALSMGHRWCASSLRSEALEYEDRLSHRVGKKIA